MTGPGQGRPQRLIPRWWKTREPGGAQRLFSPTMPFATPPLVRLPRDPFGRALTLAVAASLLVSGAARAQESAGAEPDTSFLVGEAPAATVGLSLDQAQRLATANSPAGRSALAAWRSARGARMREAGSFDPALFAEGSRVSTDSPVSSPFAGSELRQRGTSGGLSWLSPIGTSLNFSLSQTQIESNAP